MSKYLSYEVPQVEDTRILLVDDEKRILDSFAPLLQDLGYHVRTASTPDEALTTVCADRFDIVFIDQFLGSARGLELLPRMSTLHPDQYYVIITGNGSTDLAVEALKCRASDFISKPFFVNDLIRSIDYVNRKREIDRQRKEMLLRLEHDLGKKEEELRNVYFPVLSSLAQAMEMRDICTYGHSMRVMHYSRLIATALDLGIEDRENLNVAAMLHDIGKIGTSDFILGKPGPLTSEEIAVVRNHPRKGVEILKPLMQSFAQFDRILPAILHHHENFDGSGYPDGLSGDCIPLLARIISVADTYDAILSDRPYRPASSHDKAMEELIRNAGRQFEPMIVNAFLEAGDRYHHLFGSFKF
jgi:putative two-component system response regulator